MIGLYFLDLQSGQAAAKAFVSQTLPVPAIVESSDGDAKVMYFNRNTSAEGDNVALVTAPTSEAVDGEFSNPLSESGNLSPSAVSPSKSYGSF